MNQAQAIECAQIICCAYPNTAGSPEVYTAYARHFLPLNYTATSQLLHNLAVTHDGNFCPSLKVIFDHLSDQFIKTFYEELDDAALAEYHRRFLPGDKEHWFGFRFLYRSQVKRIDRAAALAALQEGLAPEELLTRAAIVLEAHKGLPVPVPVRSKTPRLPTDNRIRVRSIADANIQKFRDDEAVVRQIRPRRTPEEIEAAARELQAQLDTEKANQ